MLWLVGFAVPVGGKMGHIPGHGLLQPLINPVARLESQQGLRLGNISLGMAYIACAKIRIFRAVSDETGELFHQQRAQHFIKLIQAGALIERGIVNLIDRIGIVGQSREQVGLDDIFNKGEIAAGFAVTLDVQGFIPDKRGYP